MIVSAAQARLVLTTAGSRDEADRLAAALVEAHLAACVSLIPGVASVYCWQEKVETADEVLLLIKTTVENLDAVEALLCRLHSYQLPELLVLHPDSAGHAYLDWLLSASAGR